MSGVRLILAMMLLVGGVWALLFTVFPDRSIAVPVAYCNLNQGPCATHLFSRMTLVISPRPILTGESHTAVLLIDNASIERAELEVSAVDLDMGTSVTALVKTHFGFIGRVRVPACVHGNLTWKARLILHRKDSDSVTSFYWKKSKRRFFAYRESI